MLGQSGTQFANLSKRICSYFKGTGNNDSWIDEETIPQFYTRSLCYEICEDYPEYAEIKQFLEAGATPNVTIPDERYSEYSVIHMAALKNSRKLIKLLYWHGASLLRKHTKTGETALHMAAKHNLLDVAATLLELDRDIISEEDNRDWTPLHTAVHAGNTSMVKLLLSYRASVNTHLDYHCRRAQTPLHVATVAEKYYIASDLLSAGADPNAIDEFGLSPLHLAVLNNDLNLANLLLKKGAEINAKIAGDDSISTLVAPKKHPFESLFKVGETALDIASRLNNVNMYRFLRDHEQQASYLPAQKSSYLPSQQHNNHPRKSPIHARQPLLPHNTPSQQGSPFFSTKPHSINSMNSRQQQSPFLMTTPPSINPIHSRQQQSPLFANRTAPDIRKFR